MPELIDKKRTEATVFLIARHFIDRPDREVELVKAVIHRCCEEIDNQSAIEAEPVRHGRWILKILPIGGGDKIRSYLCSECDRYVNMKFDFCPNCGSKMDGKFTLGSEANGCWMSCAECANTGCKNRYVQEVQEDE